MGMRRLYRIVKDALKLITTPSKHIEERDLEVMGIGDIQTSPFIFEKALAGSLLNHMRLLTTGRLDMMVSDSFGLYRI
jgi:hypothetical protein